MEIIFLPAIESYSSLHRKYLIAIQQCESVENLTISLSTFCRVWKNYSPEIKFLTPRSDLCYLCKTMRFNASNWTIEERDQKVSEWNTHIKAAYDEREYYK